ncbi:MAG: ABC transporter ATP-binding protein [Thaumarchaeota archaeon]|nr:ABC transporter ATP-binding protein [Nitrososphaerota archaeon]
MTKKFRLKGEIDIVALNSVSIQVRDGEVFGLLGPNGAGKTTFMRLISCLLSPTSGTLEVAGFDCTRNPVEIRNKIGLLCEEPGLYERQTVFNNLSLYGELYGMERDEIEDRIDELSALLDFKNLLEMKSGRLSKGQRQRVSLARALLHEPEILLLDEPTANLDPVSANAVREAIRQIQRQSDNNRIVIVCSHNLDEVEKLCKRVAIIDNGHIVETGSIDNLEHELWKSESFEIVLKGGTPSSDFLEYLAKLDVVGDVQIIHNAREEPIGSTDSHLVLKIGLRSSPRSIDRNSEDIIADVVKLVAAQSNLKIVSVSSEKHSLEDVYLKLMRDKMDDVKEFQEMSAPGQD